MDIEIKKSATNELHFVMKGERHTFPNLLRETLLQDSSVIFAAYTLQHPLGSECEFVVKTKGKTAKKALDDAAKQVEKKLLNLKKLLKLQIKAN